MSRHRGENPIAIRVRRYVVPEIVGTAAALLGAAVGYTASGSIVIAAVVASLAETVGYYVPVAVRTATEFLRAERAQSARGRRRGGLVVVTATRTVRSIAAEFGLAEIADTAVVRPLALTAAAAALGPTPLGWLAGKVASDAVFYGITLTSFTLFQRIIVPRHPKASS